MAPRPAPRARPELAQPFPPLPPGLTSERRRRAELPSPAGAGRERRGGGGGPASAPQPLPLGAEHLPAPRGESGRESAAEPRTTEPPPPSPSSRRRARPRRAPPPPPGLAPPPLPARSFRGRARSRGRAARGGGGARAHRGSVRSRRRAGCGGRAAAAAPPPGPRRYYGYGRMRALRLLRAHPRGRAGSAALPAGRRWIPAPPGLSGPPCGARGAAEPAAKLRARLSGFSPVKALLKCIYLFVCLFVPPVSK